MKHSVEYPTKTRMQLSVTLDAKDLAEVKPLTLARMAQKLKIPGFRKGKVPAALAEKHLLSNAVADQVAEDAASKFVVIALESEKIQVLERPSADVVKYVPNELLELKAEADILPEMKLGDYKKVSVKKDKVTTTDKELTDVLENLQRQQAEKKTVDRAAKKGDEVWINFDGTDKDGKPVPGASGKDYPLALGSDTFIPGFEPALVGKKASDEFELPLTFPKDYHHKALAGAKVTFKVKVNKVSEVMLPEVDDMFAAKSGDFASVKALKDDIKRELVARKEHEANEAYKNALIDAVLAKSDIPVPQILAKDQLASLERDMQQNLLYRGLTLEGYLEEQKLTKEQWVEKELRPTAEKRVQTGLLLAELSKAEKIEVTQGELNARLKEMLKQYPNMREQLNTPEARRDIANRTLTEKTIDRLAEINSTK